VDIAKSLSEGNVAKNISDIFESGGSSLIGDNKAKY